MVLARNLSIVNVCTNVGVDIPAREFLLNELYGLVINEDRVERRGEYASHSPFSAP
jgi:hypothetical protein